MNKENFVDKLVIKPRIRLISYFVTTMVITQLFASGSLYAYGQALSDNDAIILMVNIDRIRTQLWLTEQSLSRNDHEMAFAHAFIPHTMTFPAIKAQLEKTAGDQSTKQIESLLTDLPLKIQTGEYSEQKVKETIAQIRNLLDQMSQQALGQNILSNKAMISQGIVFLLRDAAQSYSSTISNASNGSSSNNNDNLQRAVDYENAVGAVQTSHQNYQITLSPLIEDSRRKSEIETFFKQLEESISQKLDNDSILRLTTAIERDLAEELTLDDGSNNSTGGDLQKYFVTIKSLLSEVVSEVNNSNYEKADQYAVSAYLDNYEYLETPIEKHDPALMQTIEEEMREELRKRIELRESVSSIEAFVNSILIKLDQAEDLLKNDIPSPNQGSSSPAAPSASSSAVSSGRFADIEGLKAGFGTYTGERRNIGEAEDRAKTAVRSNIDAIRTQLD
ncbi:MAG: hypothetical protein ACJ70Q_05760, partial [Nitrososphaera sp.]